MLRIHFSNDTGQLADLLLDRLAKQPVVSPFDAEQIIVPGTGMRRYLELKHADRFGISANLNFSYPAQWIWRLVARVLGADEEDSPYSAEVMTWRIYSWLTEGQQREGKRLATYLQHSDAMMRFELATRIAGLLEQMVTYRPDWLAAWAAGNKARLPGANEAQLDDEAWLAETWREIMRGTGGPIEHPVRTLLGRLARTDAALLGLPTRVSLFGLTEVPPLYLDFMAQLANHIDVDIYLFNPCAQYWFDIISPQRRARLEASGKIHGGEVGNVLLAQWGQQSRALIESVVGLTEDETIDAYREHYPNSMLGRLQHAMVDLEDIEAGSLAADNTIVVHVCHSLARQIEVLHDQLLARFAADPSLAPGDVLVVMPDLDAAAPSIDAVFGTIAWQDKRHIPYRISGLGAKNAAPLTRALLDLLGLHSSRFTASTMFGLLQQPAIARRFGLDGEGLALVHRWMHDTGMRWGRDAQHRDGLGLPASERHTLGHGFKQLFLGYALPLPGHEDFADCLPYTDLEGQSARHLGGFWKFYTQACACADELSRTHTPADWATLLHRMLEQFFAPLDEEIDELLRLREAIADLPRLTATAQAQALQLPIGIVMRVLEDRVAERNPGATASGAVTFTGISPLRQLPFRLICILGLEHSAFPGESRADEFDLMAAFGRKSDRQRRRDDRNVFLDLLLCAGDAVHLSYTGRDIRSNGAVPPSALVSELLDYLQHAYAGPDSIRQRIETCHPAQGFSTRYFDGLEERLFSYNQAYCDATGQSGNEDPPPFFAAPLGPPAQSRRSLPLDDLIRFLQQPIAFLLRQRLHIALHDEDEELQDHEPFRLEQRESWQFRDRVLELTNNISDQDELRRVARLINALPEGVAGELELQTTLSKARDFTRQLALLRAPLTHEPIALQRAIGPYTVSAELTGLSERGQLISSFRAESPRVLLDAWVRHLILCLAAPPGVALMTQWIGDQSAFHLREVDDPRSHMEQLLDLYWEGLQRPVHFFPRSAFKFARSGKISDAQQSWHSEFPRGRPESTDFAYRLAFGERVTQMIDQEFEDLAHLVCTPLFDVYSAGVHA